MSQNKHFDCVKMKREASSKVYKQIETMTPNKEIRYWKDASKKLKNRIQALKKRFTKTVV